MRNRSVDKIQEGITGEEKQEAKKFYKTLD